jgi:Pyridoxamine 5'-phosphate oxidase
MTPWAEFCRQSPDLADRIQACFERHPHHVLGTLNAAGAPRLSGINVFFNDGVLWFGSMPSAQKVRDIERDERIAVHSAPLSETLDGGDARVSGHAVRLDARRVRGWRPETPGDGIFFEITIERVHLVEVDNEELVVTMWDSSRGVRIVKRS